MIHVIIKQKNFWGRTKKLSFCIDSFRNGVISGWAWFIGYPKEYLDIELLFKNRTIDCVCANTYREDLKQSGVGDGRHAFCFRLPKEVYNSSGEGISLHLKGRKNPLISLGGYEPYSESNYSRSFHQVQDMSFPLSAERAENIIVILVPEHNTMSGGIYSFFSIAKTIYNLRFKHDYTVLLMTRPNNYDTTYTRQSNFRNCEDVFRFEQIQRCRAARTVYLHIPEYAAPNFIQSLDADIMSYLKSREKLYVNILNQKIDIMPEKESFDDLRSIADGISQSVAHHAYSSQKVADQYDLPTLLLPAYTDLSGYESIAFEDKEKLIIYSPDVSPYRERTLQNLREGLPDYELREIRDITFDQFMDLATRCRFSVTFGEGFDGYLAQPIYQGGIGFAVYNKEFFPSKRLIDFENIFSSGEDMVNNIVPKIRTLEKQPEVYRMVNQEMIDVYNNLYSKEEYVDCVLKLIHRQFDYFPLHLSSASGINSFVRPPR